MAEDVQTWVRSETLAKMARAMVEALGISESVGSAGTYQNPVKSGLLQACDALPRRGLLKAGDLLTLADAFDRARSTEYTTAVSGSYEMGDRNLRRAVSGLFDHSDSFVKMATAEKVVAMLGNRQYG